MQQRTFDFFEHIPHSFDQLIMNEENAQVLSALLTWLEKGIEEPMLYLWGAEGSGKTHLLKAACNAVRSRGGKAYYFSNSAEDGFSYEQCSIQSAQSVFPLQVVQSLVDADLVCFDAIDALVGDRHLELYWIEGYHRMIDQEAGHCRWLVAADRPPKQLDCIHADMQSRLSSALTFQINALTDQEKCEALKGRAVFYGFELSDKVAQYILTHASRETEDLFHALKACDQLSLASHRAITIPLVKSVLEENRK